MNECEIFCGVLGLREYIVILAPSITAFVLMVYGTVVGDNVISNISFALALGIVVFIIVFIMMLIDIIFFVIVPTATVLGIGYVIGLCIKNAKGQ